MNSKHKRLLAMVLVCALTIGILPALSLPAFAAGEAAAVSGPVYQAAHADAMMMDGAQDEICLTDGKLSDGRGFGVLWNRSNLYFAVESKEGDTSLSITVGGQKVTVNKNGTVSGINGATAVWGEIVEVSVPFTVTSYEQVTALSVSMGKASWSGSLLYSSLERTQNVKNVGASGWQLGSSAIWGGGAENALPNGFHFISSDKMVESNNYRVNLIGQFSALKSHEKNLNYEFDYRADKLPVVKAQKGELTYIHNIGMTMIVTDGNNQGFNASFANTSNGLIFAVIDKSSQYSYVELGKKLGDEFHVRVEWTTDNKLALYIDGALLKVFENITITMQGRGWGGTNYLGFILKQNKTPESDSDAMDVTVTNVCFGNSYDEHPLAGLDFSAISGKNEYATNVEYDLDLMDAYANPSGHFPAQEITWDSAREDYVTDDGKVTPGAYSLVVGLTAALKSDPTVNTEIWVKVVRKSAKFMVTSKDEVTMALDGRIAEGDKAWRTEIPFSFTQGTGAPSGKLYGAWGQGKIYIAVEHKGAKTLELKLNRKTLTLDLATGKFTGESYGAEAKVSGSIAEIYLPLLDLGLYAYEYEQVTRFEAKLVNGDASATISKYQMDLRLTSEVKYEQDLSTGEIHGDPEISADGSSAVLKPVMGEQSLQMNDLTEVNHSKDLTFSQTLQFTSLPISTGGIKSLTDASNGYNFWIVDGAAGGVQEVLRAKIYNNSSKGLVLQIVKDNDLAVEEIVLGKAASATAPAFKLDVVWGADDSVKVYVDGVLKGSIAKVAVTHDAGEMGSDGFGMRCAQSNITVTVTNISFTQPATELNFSEGSLKGGATVGNNGSSVTLNTVSGGQAAEQSVAVNDLSTIDHSKDIVFVQKLSIGAMAAGNGGYSSLTDTANGYNFWLIDGAANTTQAVLRGKIYNHATKGLVLQIVKDNALTIAEIELGKKVGDSFELKITWSADGKTAVAVDGEKKGEAEVSVTYDGGAMGNDGFYLGCKTEGIKVTVSGVSLPQAPEKVDMSGATTVNGATVNSDGSVTLNPPLTPQMIQLKDLAALDHSKNILFSQKLTVTALPVSAGNANESEGYTFCLAAGPENGPQSVLVARVYHDAAKGLVLQIVKDVATGALENIELGKAEGDSFTLELLWNADDSVKVSVDGTVKATVTVDVTLTNGGMETNSLMMNCTEAGTKVGVSDVILRNVAGNINFNDMSNYKTTINAAGTEATFTGSGENRINQMHISGLEQMDYTKSVMLSQTLNVVAMPDDVPMAAAANSYNGTSYYFFMVDGASSGTVSGMKRLTMANLYNSSTKGLVLQVQTGNDGAGIQEVVLGKQVGDTFKLDYLWCAGSSTMKVYVDGELKGVVLNAVRAKNLTDNTIGYDGISLRKLNEETTIKVTNVSVEQIDIAEPAKEDLTTYSAVGGANVNGTMGGRPVTYLDKNGVTALDHSKDITVLMDLTISQMALNESREVYYDSENNSYFYHSAKSFSFYMYAGALGQARTQTFACLYNKENVGLVLQVELTDGNFQEVVLNKQVGDNFQLGYKWKASNSVEVYVDGVLKGTVNGVDHAAGVSTNAAECNNIRLVTAKATTRVNLNKLVISNEDVFALKTATMSFAGATTEGNPAITNNGTAVNFNVGVGTAQSAYKNDLPVIDHSKDMIFSQNIYVESMAAGSPMVANGAYQETGTGYYFLLSGNGVQTFANIYNDSVKGLVLQVQTADGNFVDMVLGKQAGDTFNLQYVWNNDNTVKVYVDGKLKGAAMNTACAATFGNNGVSVNCAAASTKVTVSDLTVEYTQIKQDVSTFTNAYTYPAEGVVTLSRSPSLIQKDGITELDHSKDIWISQVLSIPTMVLDSPMVKGEYINGNGYFFWAVAGNSGAAKAMLLCNMYNSSTNGLTLQLQRSDREFDEVILDKEAGDTFQLSVLWRPDGSATVYVDGAEKGTVADATYSGIGTGNSYGYNQLRCVLNGPTGTLVHIADIIVANADIMKGETPNVDLSGAAVSGDVAVSGASANFNVTPMQFATQNGLEVVDHSKDTMLSQVIKVTAMPTGNAMASGTAFNPVGTDYYFMLTDGASGAEKKLIFANLYNSAADGLVLQVQQADGKMVNAKLGKKVGDTFTLNTLWGKDNTVKIYVDDVLKATVGNATISTQGDGCGFDGYQLRSTGTGTNITVSDAYIDYVSVCQDLHTYANGYTGLENGIATFTRSPSVLYKNNMPEINHNKDIMLSQMISVAQMAVDNPKISGVTNAETGTNYFYFMVSGGLGESKTLLNVNIYNDSAKGLTAQIMQADQQLVDIPLGKQVGDMFELSTLWKTDGTATLYVDGVEVGLAENVDYKPSGVRDDYAQMLRLVCNGAGTNVQVSGVVVGEPNVFAPVVPAMNMASAVKTGNVSVNGSVVTFDMKAEYQIIKVDGLTEVNHGRDLTLSQVLTINDLPSNPMVAETNYAYIGSGYYFWMIDGAEEDYKHMVFGNIYDDETWGLVLQVQDHIGGMVDVKLDKKVGDTFKLDFTWVAADGSVKVYVDGALKGTVENATRNYGYGTGCGYDGYQLRSRAFGADVMVSDVYLTPGVRYTNVKDEITVQTVLDGVVDLNKVTETNKKLPAVFKSPYLGDVPLTWTSSDTNVWNLETGAITHGQEKVGKYTTLTAFVPDQRTKQIFRVEACVTGLGVIEIKSPKVLNASYATNVVLDGTINSMTDTEVTHEGWHVSTLLGTNGRFGVQWDSKNLYLAVLDQKPEEANALAITIKGKSVDLSKAVKADNFLEIAIPMSSLGIATNNYGAELAATVTLGEESWSGTIKLTSTDWLVSSTTAPGVPCVKTIMGAGARGADQPTEFQGAEIVTDGWHFFDLYNVNGFNPASIRTSALLMGLLNNQEPWEFEILKPIGDRNIANYHEFDFFAQSMPVYQLGTDDPTHPGFATCGFFWWVVGEAYNEFDSTAPCLCLGIINTNDGLIFVSRGPDGDQFTILNKYVGDYFRIAVRWEITGDITVYVDNEEVGYHENVQSDWNGFGEYGVCLNTLRSTDVARSSNDNIDVTATNFAIGLNYGDTLLDTLTWEVIRGKNVRNMEAVTRDVILVDTWQTSQLATPQKVTWTSSDESVLNSKTGDVTRPEGNGKQVFLTAHCGGEEKVFELYVKGRNPDGITMGVIKDKNAGLGVGKPENETYWFTLDDNNNSVIYDQGETKKVNYIELTDTDEFNRLNESVLTIWYSDSNRLSEDANGETIPAYTRIEGDFKILRVGNKTYLYDFEIEARYIKVHGCHYKATEADFVGVLSEMLRVGYNDIFGDGDTEFATENKVVIKNENDYPLYDRYFKLSPAEAGVNCLKADKSDVRFLLGNEHLYHYFDGENFVVRVPDILANGEVALTVLSGNANAMDISNKEYVYEVVYGTREAYQDEVSRWYLTMPDGDLWSFKDDGSGNVGFRISKDQGMTWSESTTMQGVQDIIGEPTGALFDDELGRLIVYAWNRNAYGACTDNFMYSDDYGKTWNKSTTKYEGRAPDYSISYSCPVKVSASYDGYGPGVDYVQNTSDVTNYWEARETGDPHIFCTRVLYSTDCGETWIMGVSEINYLGEGVFKTENGMNEATIMEDEEGRLVLLARNQWGNVDQFGMAYSYDHGITWETEKGEGNAVLSSVYAPNTQPIMFKFQGGKYLCWGGNNVLGGGSYQRFPMCIGVSYDGMASFENIQDVYSRLSCQGMTVSTRCNIVNQTVGAQGESLTMAWVDSNGTVHMRIDDFHNYFYRTRSAYDSFENSTVKYEGWATGVGMAETSDKYATDGKYSMQIGSFSAVVRSVPYVQNGKLSFDLYIENMATADFELELESAYGTVHGKAAPIAMRVRNGKLYALNEDHSAEVEIPCTLKNGWNSIAFDLSLAQETSEATLSVNGGNAVAVPVDQAIGDYVCYVHITSNQKDYLYLDNFFLDDQDAQYVPDQAIEAEVTDVTEVPEKLKETYTDVDSMTAAMQDAILNQENNIFTAENMAAYNVTLNYTRDGGKNWSVATNDLIPTEGVTITLPYPEGTSAETHTFTAAMMATSDSYRLGYKTGDVVILNVENGEEGVLVTVKGHGPVMLAWSETGSAPIIPDDGGEATAPDNTWIIIVIAVVVVLALAGAVVVIILKKKSTAAAPAEADETPDQE